MAIQTFAVGAYTTLLKLEGGAIKSLLEYQQSGDDTTIVGVSVGAYQPLIENSEGKIVTLVDHLRSTGGQLIAKSVSGAFQPLVKSDSGMTTLTEAVYEEEQAAQS